MVLACHQCKTAKRQTSGGVFPAQGEESYQPVEYQEEWAP